MSIQVEKLEHNMAKLTIEVSAEEFEKGMQAAYLKQRGKIQIPGFRKGKVPRQVIEKMYGAEVFYEDAANEVIPTAYEAALEEVKAEVEPVSRPKIDAVQLEKGKAFIFTAEVATKPPVELGEYKGLKIEKVEAVVTDEDVTAELDRERDKNSRIIEITDRAVKDGDMITLDFDGSVDGVPFDGGKATNYPLTIGSNTFIPGFEDQLIGAEIDAEVTVNVTFPEEYQEKSLAGKAAQFVCKVTEIREKELPELNDDFAAEVSEFETLDEYKADVRKNLEERKQSEAKREKESKAVEALVAVCQMDIPDAMADFEAERLANDYARRLSSQGLSIEQYFQYTGMTAEKMIDQLRPQALDNIKSRLCLEAVVAAENITVSDDEYQEELKKMAEIYGLEVEEFSKNIGDDEKEAICKDVAIQKAVDVVVDNAVEE